MSYDIDAALASVAKIRRHVDPLARSYVQLGDNLAASIAADVPAEMLEAAGIALIHATARLGGMIEEATPSLQHQERHLAAILVNVQGVAGERLVRDGRALYEVPVT